MASLSTEKIMHPFDKVMYKTRDEDESTVRSSQDDEGSTSSQASVSAQRAQWGSNWEFLMSCVSYSIGLGNLWRFPYKCYSNGGGAFLVPYFAFLLFAGMPIYFLELSMGQFTSQGPFGVFKIAPLFNGLAYAMFFIVFICCLYYNVIVAWIIHFLFVSFKSVIWGPLPWSQCPPLPSNGNETVDPHWCGNPSEYYWKRVVLQQSDDISDFNGVQWEIFATFCIAWIMVFLVLCKGVKSSGKFSYFTAIFPYFVLTALLIRGVTLDGAMIGIRYYIYPDFERLMNISVWNDAACQIFYSLGLSFGTLFTLSSYNSYNNNILRATLAVTCINSCTSIWGGFIIFSVIGSLAHETGKSIADVVDSGAGLAFIVYPDAVTKFPASVIWAILFFFMLFALGMGSQIAMVESVVTSIVDQFPRLLRAKPLVCLASCAVMFALGLPMVTRSGMYWLTLLDTYGCSYSLFIVALLEIVCFVYVFGWKRIYVLIESMIGRRPTLWFAIHWVVSVPVIIISIFTLTIWFYAPAFYEKPLPLWSQYIGYGLAFISLVWIPVCAVYSFFTVKGTFLERITLLLNPESDFRPFDDADFKKVEDLLRRDNLKSLTSQSWSAKRTVVTLQHPSIPDLAQEAC